VCSCSQSGACETNNLFKVWTGVPTEDDCVKACQDSKLCSNYNFFNDDNSLTGTSCLLLSSCDNISTDCFDCHTGVPHCKVCNYGDFKNGQCLTTRTSPAPETALTSEAENIGILIIGSKEPQPAEFWSPTVNSKGTYFCPESSWLDYHFGDNVGGSTANFVAGKLVVCNLESCDIYEHGVLTHVVKTESYREYHSSAQTEDKVLLIGGWGVNTTEWIPLDGSMSQPGPFEVPIETHGGGWHCTIQVSYDVIVVTGGGMDGPMDTLNYVTEYHLNNATETVMTPMNFKRAGHACGVYQEAGGQQVLLVTGGEPLYSTEMADYSAGSQLVWRKVEGGELPTLRVGPRATVVNNVIYLSGGFDGDKELTTVLSWDPAGQTWKEAGNLTVPRSWHAAVAVPLAFGREMEDSAPECNGEWHSCHGAGSFRRECIP